SSCERLEDERRRLVHVAGTESEHGVSRPSPTGDETCGVLQRRGPADPHAGTKSRELVDDEPPADTGNRLLPRRVDLRHARGIRPGERLGETVAKVERP